MSEELRSLYASPKSLFVHILEQKGEFYTGILNGAERNSLRAFLLETSIHHMQELSCDRRKKVVESRALATSVTREIIRKEK